MAASPPVSAIPNPIVIGSAARAIPEATKQPISAAAMRIRDLAILFPQAFERRPARCEEGSIADG